MIITKLVLPDNIGKSYEYVNGVSYTNIFVTFIWISTRLIQYMYIGIDTRPPKKMSFMMFSESRFSSVVQGERIGRIFRLLGDS
jgi:hypothetical protein